MIYDFKDFCLFGVLNIIILYRFEEYEEVINVRKENNKVLGKWRSNNNLLYIKMHQHIVCVCVYALT